MKSKLVSSDKGRRIFFLAFDRGDEVAATLKSFAQEQQLFTASLSGVGGFSEVTLGYFDKQTRQYEPIKIREQVEVVAVSGNFTVYEDQPRLHAHVVVAKRDGSAHGGHLLEAFVWPTTEIIVHELPALVRRSKDKETGLPLVDVGL